MIGQTSEQAQAGRAFYGLAAMELWERFSLHGMRALLTLYLLHEVLPAGSDVPWGLAAVRHGLEAVWGPLTALGFASQIYGLYVAATYLAVPIGGLFGDRMLGRSGAVLLGGILIAAGHACLTVPFALLPALSLLVIGTGLLKANLAVQVGDLYARDDPRRGAAFARYLGFLNIGVMLGPLVCGWLAQRMGWSYGFAAAGGAMIVGLLIYARTPVVAPRDDGATGNAPPAGPPGSMVIASAAIVVTILAFCAYEQVSNLFLVWIDRTIRLDLGGFAVPPAWFLAADGLLTILMVLLTTRVPGIAKLRHGGRLVAGCAAIVLGYVVLAGLSLIGARAIWSPLLVLACLDLGVVLIWPAALAIVTAVAPRGWGGAIVGIFYLHGFFANLAVGVIGGLYERLSPATFWMLHAGIAALGLAVALMLRPQVAYAEHAPAHG